MRISGCLITKNEENNIEKCINSFKGVVREIIVVDTGSTDRTVEIARQLGAKVFYYEWDNSFANARNYALERAFGDWIIFLDADEYFADDTGINIPAILKKIHKNKNIDGLLCRCFHIEKSTQTVNSSDFMMRVFRNDRRIRYVGNIHESLMKSGKNVSPFRVSQKMLKMYHTGYSAEIIKDKHERNLNYLLDNLKKDPTNSMTFYYLSDSYFGQRKHDLAIKYARLYIDSGIRTVSHNVKPHLNLINSMIVENYRIEDIVIEVNKALERFPQHPDIYAECGMAFFSNKKYSEALKAYEKAVEFSGTYDDMEVVFIYSYLDKIYYHLGLIYTYKNEYVRALECFVKSLRQNKLEKETFIWLMRLVRNENPEDIILLLKSIYDENSHSDIEFLVRNLSGLGLGTVLLYYSNIWYKKLGQEDSALMFMLLANGKYDEAFRYFTECYSLEKSEWAELFSVVSALLGNSEDNRRSAKNNINLSFKKIIDAYCGYDKNVVFEQEDIDNFSNILRQFILLGTEEEVKRFIRLKNGFKHDISCSVGDVLVENMVYNWAVEQYDDSLTVAPDKGELYYKRGFCFYKMNFYAEALQSFENALIHGYRENDIYEIVQWIYEKCDNADIKRNIEKFIKDNAEAAH